MTDKKPAKRGDYTRDRHAVIDSLTMDQIAGDIRKPSKRRLDSVNRHQVWQKGLKKDEFFARVMR